MNGLTSTYNQCKSCKFHITGLSENWETVHFCKKSGNLCSETLPQYNEKCTKYNKKFRLL